MSHFFVPQNRTVLPLFGIPLGYQTFWHNNVHYAGLFALRAPGAHMGLLSPECAPRMLEC